MTLASFGLRVHGGMPASACIDMARLAEASGFSTLWYAENPFSRGVLPAVAGSLLSTSQLNVGIGVFNPYNRHPTLIAMEIGALDELAPGRIRIGLGSGIGTAIERMGLSYAKPLGAVRDGVTILRGMLAGETVNYAGNVFSVTDMKLEFAVPNPNMPIYMAAMGEQALRLAGQVSDGLMISNMCPPGFTQHARSLMAQGAAKAGRAVPTEIIQYVPCAIRRDGEEARTLIKGTIGGMLGAYWRMGERWPAMREAMAANSGVDEDEMLHILAKLAAGEPAAQVLDQRFVDAYAVAGTPEECAASIDKFDAAGVTELIFTMIGSQPHDDLALLGDALKLR